MALGAPGAGCTTTAELDRARPAPHPTPLPDGRAVGWGCGGLRRVGAAAACLPLLRRLLVQKPPDLMRVEASDFLCVLDVFLGSSKVIGCQRVGVEARCPWLSRICHAAATHLVAQRSAGVALALPVTVGGATVHRVRTLAWGPGTSTNTNDLPASFLTHWLLATPLPISFRTFHSSSYSRPWGLRRPSGWAPHRLQRARPP